MTRLKVAVYTLGKTAIEIQKDLEHMREKFSLFDPLRHISEYYYDFIDDNNILNTTELNKLFARIIETKDIEILILPSLDTLGKDFEKINSYLSICKDNNVKILPIAQIDTFLLNSPPIIEKKLSSLPYGYIWDEKTKKPIPDKDLKVYRTLPLNKRKTGDIVIWIFREFIKYKNYAVIANILNKQRVKSPGILKAEKFNWDSTPHGWNRQQVKNILMNPFYVGQVENHNYEPLISLELWTKVQQKIHTSSRQLKDNYE